MPMCSHNIHPGCLRARDFYCLANFSFAGSYIGSPLQHYTIDCPKNVNYTHFLQVPVE